MNPNSRRPRRARQASGFTLVEVMVTMVFLSMIALGVFTGMQQITRAMTAIALRSEAHHLLQAEAERLLASPFVNFTASPNQSITSSFKTTYVPSASVNKLTLTPDNARGRVTFIRHVDAIATTSQSATLRVEVDWTWQGRAYAVSTLLYRPQGY